MVLPVNDTELESRYIKASFNTCLRWCLPVSSKSIHLSSSLSLYCSLLQILYPCFCRLKAEKATAFKAYAQTQEAFADSPAFSEVKNYLAAELEKICEQRRDENYQAYIKEVRVLVATVVATAKL